MKSSILLLAGISAQEGGCSIDAGVLEPRPFHKGLVFWGCDNQAEGDVVPNGTACKKVYCRQFKFSYVTDVTCENGQWSALPECFKGCPAPQSAAGYQFVQCRKNLGQGTSPHKGWYNDENGTAFYPPRQRCRKVMCPSAIGVKKSDLPEEYRDQLSHKDPERLECTCDNNGDCYWINFNDEDHGLSINDDVNLSCASWSEWDETGACTKKKRTQTRRCLQPNGEEGTPGVDCEGDAENVVACGRRGF